MHSKKVYADDVNPVEAIDTTPQTVKMLASADKFNTTQDDKNAAMQDALIKVLDRVDISEYADFNEFDEVNGSLV